jgi:hypothetical protein
MSKPRLGAQPDTVHEAEPDCPHWPPDALDLEPEQCFCLRCGKALPCICAAPEAYTSLLRGDAA